MNKDYKTVSQQSQDEFTEKRSRFIGYVKPVKTEEEATAFIGEIRSKHWDARHNVYAYSLREGNIKRYGAGCDRQERPLRRLRGRHALFRRYPAGYRRLGARLFPREQDRPASRTSGAHAVLSAL